MTTIATVSYNLVHNWQAIDIPHDEVEAAADIHIAT